MKLKAVKKTGLITTDIELNQGIRWWNCSRKYRLIAGEPGIGKSTLFLQNGFEMSKRYMFFTSAVKKVNNK